MKPISRRGATHEESGTPVSIWRGWGSDMKARAVASIVPGAAIKEVAEGTPPAPGRSKVERLKGGDYLRVWASSISGDELHAEPASVNDASASTAMCLVSVCLHPPGLREHRPRPRRTTLSNSGTVASGRLPRCRSDGSRGFFQWEAPGLRPGQPRDSVEQFAPETTCVCESHRRQAASALMMVRAPTIKAARAAAATVQDARRCMTVHACGLNVRAR
jgi:hypothetical protein